MREEVAKSLKLNRELSVLLVKALKSDTAIKIGWGKANDPRPRDGEMGVAPHLPDGARVRMLGNIGDLTAICASGGNFSLEGETGALFGAWNRGGRLTVEKDCGVRPGMGMEDGRIVIHGSAGSEAGACMSGGLLVVRGSAGRRCGGGMSGGTLVIMGDVDGDVGCNMQGGRIIVNGRCPPPGEGAITGPMDEKELADVNGLLSELGFKVDADAVCITADGKNPTRSTAPESDIDAAFEAVSLVSGGNPRLLAQAPLDLLTVLHLRGEEKGILLPLPLLLRLPDGKGLKGAFTDRQPCLVSASPRDCDLLCVGMGNLHDCAGDLASAAGAVVCIDDLPPLNDAELDALIVIVRSHLGDDKPILLGGGVDRVDLVHRLAVDLGCDGAIANTSTPARLPAAASLPLIGLSAREHSIARKGVASGISLPWAASPEDILICCAGGGQFIVVDPLADIEKPKSQKARAEAVESWLAEMDAGLRGHLIEIGEDGIDQLNRRHLRALDHDTASISGIRLAGYDRPLPHWLGQ